jgi:hypothetical protein
LGRIGIGWGARALHRTRVIIRRIA